MLEMPKDFDPLNPVHQLVAVAIDASSLLQAMDYKQSIGRSVEFFRQRQSLRDSLRLAYKVISKENQDRAEPEDQPDS